MSPALNYKALLYATPTHLPSICPFTRPHVIISALSMHLPPVLWAWIRAPATHFLGARILTTLPLSIPPAAFSALPQHLPSPFSVIILSSQYLFQRGPIWISLIYTSQSVDWIVSYLLSLELLSLLNPFTPSTECVYCPYFRSLFCPVFLIINFPSSFLLGFCTTLPQRKKHREVT